jgi:hypothetical protein
MMLLLMGIRSGFDDTTRPHTWKGLHVEEIESEKAGPRKILSSAAQPFECCCQCGSRNASLEHVPDADDDTTVTTVSIPLAQEASSRHDRIRRSEVASIGGVIEVGTQLKPLILTNVRVLHDAKIDVVKAISAKDVSSRVANTLSAYQRSKQIVAGGGRRSA